MKMNYKETTEYLFSQLPVFQKIGGEAYKPGLDNTLKLDAIFDQPRQAYKTIHVGGTNGKGSTSHTLAAILQKSGYKVGLYTSPHLIDFRERIRVNGEKIDEQYVIDFVDTYRPDFEPIHCSFFELTMMMAFCYFRDQQVDIAIIEVGLGGRLDSTNIITPDLSIITNVSIDHTQFLGDTVEKIAFEKAGVIKHNIPVVIGRAEGAVKDVFLKKASEVETEIKFADQVDLLLANEYVNGKWHLLTKNHGDITVELGGYAQLENAKTILLAIDTLIELGYQIPQNAIHNGFEQVTGLTGLMGRWQIIRNSPKVICDTGHNLGGVEYIVDQLKAEKYNKLHIVWGMANDKDVTHILEILPKDAIYYFVNAQINRAMPAQDLLAIAEKNGLKGKAYPLIQEAYQEALSIADKDDLIFVGGSNFVVGEFLENLDS